MKKAYDDKQTATIFVAVITAFITTFTGSALNLSIPAMGAEFSASASSIGWVVTGYMLTVAALSVPFGRMADLTSRKKVLVSGILIFAVSSLAAAFSINMGMMLVLRICQGIGAAMIFCTNMAVLISAFPNKDRGKVLGYSTASTYIGLSAGPVVGGFLNNYLGWRSIFILIFLISAIVLYTAFRKLPGDSKKLKEPLEEGKPLKWKEAPQADMLGNILYIAMIVLTLYGLSAFSTKLWAIWLIPLGIVAGVFFVRHELKTKKPVIEVRLFASNIAYAFSNLAALLNYGATFAISYLLSIYLQVVMDYSSQAAGLILIAQPLIMALLSPYAGRLSDKISPFKLASFGMALCAAGLLFFVFISESTPLWAIICALLIAGVGFAFFSSPNTNAVMACVEVSDYGVASSILATMRSIGHTTSMAIVTIIVGIYMGNTALADAKPDVLIHTMHTAFIVFTCICVVGIFISLKRKRKA